MRNRNYFSRFLSSTIRPKTILLMFFRKAWNTGIRPKISASASAYNAGLQVSAISEGFDLASDLRPRHFLAGELPSKEWPRSRNLCPLILTSPRSSPEVSHEDTFISPHIVSSGRPRRLPTYFNGIPEGELAAINSATTWRVRSWYDLGGFNTLFWLDYLDLWAFHVIQLAGKRMYVACDLQVHSTNCRCWIPIISMSPERFEKITWEPAVGFLVISTRVLEKASR